MINLAALFQNVKNMLRDKSKKKIEEIKTGFNISTLLNNHPERFSEEKVTGIFKALKMTDSLNIYIR